MKAEEELAKKQDELALLRAELADRELPPEVMLVSQSIYHHRDSVDVALARKRAQKHWYQPYPSNRSLPPRTTKLAYVRPAHTLICELVTP